MPTVQEYAQLANRVYARTQANRTPVPTGWSELRWIPDLGLTGFSAGVYQNGNNIVISYTGTNDSKVADTVWGNLPATTGLYPSEQVRQAMALYLQIARDNPAANITFTGHSLGGGLAAMMAVFFDRQAKVFDAAPFELGARSLTSLASYTAAMVASGYSNAAFLTYAGSATLLFDSREANATGYWLQGEFLNDFRVPATTIGTYTPVPTGPTTLSGLSGEIDLHSMTTLASMLTSTAFADVVQRTPTLLAQIFDKALYDRDPAVSADANFIDRLYIAQVRNSATPLLDRFATDIGKLVASPDGMTAQSAVQKALTVAAMEYYYFKDAASASALFTTSGNGIHFKFSDTGATISKALPRLVNAADAYLSTDELRVLGAITDQAQVRDDIGTGRLMAQDAWHIQSGTNGLIWSATGNDKDATIGGAQTDILDGGAGDDILIGGAGRDFLTGGANADILIGGVDVDTLDGGTGNDRLLGGQGADVYTFTGNFGEDIIQDSDGQGAITVDGATLIGGKKESANVYTAGGVTYTIVNTGAASNDLIIAPSGTANRITVRGWGNLQLGITLDDAPAAVTPTTGTFIGGADHAGQDRMAGTADADLVQGLDGNDLLAGYGADDQLKGGLGDDLIFGGLGADTINGGAGADFIYGSGEGIDYGFVDPAPVPNGAAVLARGYGWATYQDANGINLYGPTATPLVGDATNLIDGGAGDDRIDAGTGNDVAHGGDDNDTLYGLAGNDLLFGDDGAQGDRKPNTMGFVALSPAFSASGHAANRCAIRQGRAA